MLLLLFLTIISILNQISQSVECRKCTESALLPGTTRQRCNETCTGGYCYRAEHNISAQFREQANERAIIWDCFDFTLEQLKLGCRRNFEGIVLCVCQTDLCNDLAPIDIIDLPVVAECISGFESEDLPRNWNFTSSCRSQYCINSRRASTSFSNGAIIVDHDCQASRLLSRFDLFVRSQYFFVPVGMCLKMQGDPIMVFEMCSCPYFNGCSTSTKYPGESKLPLDTRTNGFVTCALYNPPYGYKQCEGHVCYFYQRARMDRKVEEEYGCITYGEGFEDRKFPLGKHRILDDNVYLCAERLCNQKEDATKFFDSQPHGNNESSCACLPPASANPQESTVSTELPLILGICIPSVIIAVLVCALIVRRVVTGTWTIPAFRKGNRRNTTVVNVVSSSAHLKEK
ncbi:hypothetical protein PRIPAC_80407 [Pristionchus pacificus]|uniref:DUF7622 domain-containing protein n=1 Tax=Pristionchus pacificus TaxID=54126 RepID=A0A2A6CP15_PRIPA|nr:hypothetical protein PRIPAC_80407 [Pristionchus pacificus]|eukprot:PDM79860.1 hypothetical protein PRIPAC_32439 [Pristionchus pacificus]